jgi:hypothetical protein
MRNPVKILHIDADYQAHYIIIREGSLIHSTVSLETAIAFLKSVEFDLILSEPHNKAILRKSKDGSFIPDATPNPRAATNQQEAVRPVYFE